MHLSANVVFLTLGHIDGLLQFHKYGIAKAAVFSYPSVIVHLPQKHNAKVKSCFRLIYLSRLIKHT